MKPCSPGEDRTGRKDSGYWILDHYQFSLYNCQVSQCKVGIRRGKGEIVGRVGHGQTENKSLKILRAE